MNKKDFVTTEKWNKLKKEKKEEMKLIYKMCIGAVGVITCLYYLNWSGKK